MNARPHLSRTSLLLLAATLGFAAGPSAAKDPVRPPDGPGPGALMTKLATLRRGPVALPHGDAGGGAERSRGPYFVVAGGGDGERLPLEETRADVSIVGPIARVQVTQVFRNRGAKPIEAIYVFPASTRAAVHGTRLRIGERTIEAKIDRRVEAKAQYEAARSEGKRAALLDEERPNVFTMRVANVMPGDRLVAELDYSELVVPEEGVYELVYPTVVGPRYEGALRQAQGERTDRSDRWIANPTLTAGAPAPYRFAFAAHLESAIPVKELASPSHALDVRWRSPRSADVKVQGEDGGNKDVVLRWRLAGDAVEAGALLFPDGDGGGWFLATVEPPARVHPEAIPPREYVFVLDVSGSMHGFPLDTAKALMEDLLPRLRPADSFNVVFFSGGSFVLSPDASLPATPANVRRALDTFRQLQGGGGTELLQALRTAYDLPRGDPRVARTLVVVTDGYVAVEAEAFRLVRERLAEASCFAFGIGTGVNRALVEALARAGQGEPTVVLSPKDAKAAAERLERIIAAPVLSQLRWRAEGLEARDVLPGALPDLLAERPVTLLGRYRGAPAGKIVLTGQSATGPYRRELDLSAAAPRAENAPLRVLWARRWVELLLDEQHLGAAKELEEAITALGLAHRLLTPYTSFVAVDSEVVNAGGAGDTVKQPLPLPEGVSNRAVGAAGGTLSLGYTRRGHALAAPATPPPASAAPEAALEEKDTARRDEPAGQDHAKVAPVTFVREAETGIGAVAPVRAAVRAALAKLSAEGLRGALELRLTLDAAGRVVKVDILRAPDAATRTRVEAALRGLATGVAPTTVPATYTVVVKLG
ncbi:MAG TPA: VIT and VWA domain-containing protein [Anaeromyxobacter sp.]|nr:VIT and VWA domain-containing protein [Anaeromyxobacter sp.]